MSNLVLVNLLNSLGKEVKREACQAFYRFFATRLLNSIIQEHEMLDSFYRMALKLLLYRVFD